MESNLIAWVTIVQGIVTILALSVGAYVALAGLSTWKHQLVAKADSDLAKRLLLTTYRLRSAISVLRSYLSIVIEHGLKEFLEDADKAIAEISSANSELDLIVVEAHAQWGRESTQAIGEVKELGWELRIAYSKFKNISDGHPDEKDSHYGTLFGEGEPKNDAFGKRLSAAVSRVENQLQPKLRLIHRRAKND